MHYYSFHIGDYKAHTHHLSLVEDIALRRLLDLYYLQEKPIVAELVSRQIGMRDQGQEVLAVLFEFFEETPEGFINKRADEEIRKFHEKQEQASKAGKASAERRRNGSSTDVQRTFNVRSTDVQPTINHKPLTNNQEPKEKAKRSRKPAATPLPDGFSVSDRVKTWAYSRGMNNLDRHLEHFIGKAQAKGYTYADWDAAFINAIREDWAGINKQSAEDKAMNDWLMEVGDA